MSQHQDIPALSQYFIEVVAASGDVNSLSTVRWYRTRLKTFLSWMQANHHVVLDDSAFNAFALHLKQRVADKTLSRDSLPGFYRVLRRFGKWLHAEGYASKDPARALKVPRPNRKNRLPKALSDDEIEKLLAASEGMPREAAMARCLHRSGARAGEHRPVRPPRGALHRRPRQRDRARHGTPSREGRELSCGDTIPISASSRVLCPPNPD